MTERPPGWTVTTVGGICAKPQYGWTTKATSETGGLRLLRTTDITSGSVDWSRVPWCTVEPDDVAKYLLEKDDIVVSRAGSVGASIRLVSDPPPTVFASYLIRLRPLSGIDTAYLAWFLKSPTYWVQVSEAAAGIALLNVNAKKLAAMEIPLPPVNEQRRIVAAIEEHLSRLDAADASLAAALRRLEGLRKATIVESIPVPGPSHWKHLTVSDVGAVDLGRQRSPRFHSGPNMRPYLRVANVFEARLDLSDVMQMDFPPADHAKYRLRHGDILLNEGQSPHLVGRPAMFRDELDDVCFTNSLIRFRPGAALDGNFALLVFRRHLHAGRFQREARITTNIAHLSAGRFKTVEFPVPPLNEQRQIVTRVEEQLSAIDALRTGVERARRRSTSLRRAVLERAFRGELVPQNPSDEPASALLEHIRAERAATPAQPLRRRLNA